MPWNNKDIASDCYFFSYNKIIVVFKLSPPHISKKDSSHFSFHVKYRSQKTALFQKQSGLNAHLSGLSLTGLAAGPVVGFSQSPRTVLKYKSDLALGHQSYVCEQIAKAAE